MKSILYTDGAARGNPGPGGWGFVLLVHDASVADQYRIVEGSGAKNPTTNNAMELSAVVNGIIEVLKNDIQKLEIRLDSKYVRDGAMSWRHGWARNGWQTKEKVSISNLELWQQLHDLLNECAAKKILIDWVLVRGHRGIPGNERCDMLATSAADGTELEINPYTIAQMIALPQTTDPYYIAFVDGVVQRFETWDDCSQYVRGKKARYKKVHSTTEEEQVIRGWNS